MTAPGTPDASVLPLIVGVAGTLLGTVLGAWATLRVQERQLRHEDHTRFHDRRLQVYSDFNDACNKAVTKVMAAGGYPGAEIQRVINLWETLRLVASQAVVDAAIPIHGAISAVIAAPGGTPPNLGAWFIKYNKDVAVLVKTMRDEIGVTKRD